MKCQTNIHSIDIVWYWYDFICVYSYPFKMWTCSIATHNVGKHFHSCFVWGYLAEFITNICYLCWFKHEELFSFCCFNAVCVDALNLLPVRSYISPLLCILLMSFSDFLILPGFIDFTSDEVVSTPYVWRTYLRVQKGHGWSVIVSEDCCK